MHWCPQTNIGKIAFWLGLSGVIIVILLNILSEKTYCEICPEGYRLDGEVCNPVCYYSVPQCLMPSVEPTCNMDPVENDPVRIINIIFGLLAMAGILASGIMSLIAIIKEKDYAILLFLPVLFGLFGLFMVIGELVFPH